MAGDLSITAANVLADEDATVVQGVFGETITAGMSLFMHTDSKLWKAKDDTAAHAACCGIALNGGAAGQPGAYLAGGGINPGATVAVGTIYGVTDTFGGIGPISERGSTDYVTTIGIATTATRIAVAIVASGVAIP